MSFLYPLFLLAGLTVAIPILIHLFNLRRYKTVFFPHTRFLKNVQLHSRKQSQVRYKWLLALRILFLLSLILAFAQPFFNKDRKAADGRRLQVIYIDNSSSMSVKKGARTMLDLAKEGARRQLQQAAPGARFLLLTNDRPASYQPISADRAMAELRKIDFSAGSKTAPQLFSTVQGLVMSEAATGADVYYYSDFQRNSFPHAPAGQQLDQIRFYGIPVRAEAKRNIYIDTAFLSSPVLQTGQPNQLVVRSRLIGSAPPEDPILQLSINGQVKNASSVSFAGGPERTDTLNFQVNGAGWQRIAVSVNDAAVRFDDTFRIAARSATNLSVLVLNEGQANPYILSAIRAYNGFRIDQRDIHETASWKDYNLILLNGVTRMSESLTGQISAALLQGQSICIFPGRTNDIAALNEGLSRVADIRVEGLDTAVQTVSTLQQGSDLVRDLFERVPENVQLPVSNWHYNISAGLSANQQTILGFRNGDPFLAQYTPSRGRLYLLASSADLPAGNFPGSYFFVPFLYQMTAQARGGDVYAVTAGKTQPVFLSMDNAGERRMVHAVGRGVDVIPPQRPSGAGLDVFVGQALQQPGFYTLTAAGSDSTAVALNQDRAESGLEFWDLAKLKGQWKGRDVSWLDAAGGGASAAGEGGASFPLWKVCVILALLMLAAESYLLAGGFRKQTVVPR